MTRGLALLLTALLAACAGAAFASTATANRLSVSETTYRMTSAAGEFENGEGGERVRCPITLSGSFSSRTFAKVNGAAIGRLSTMRIGESSCTEETELRVEASGLPVNLEYTGFEGTLPNITGVRMSHPTIPDVIKIFHRPFFYTCTYTYRPGNISTVSIIREALGWRRYIVNATLSFREGTGPCARTLQIRHEGPLMTGGGGTFTVTLI